MGVFMELVLLPRKLLATATTRVIITLLLLEGEYCIQ